jgi:GAF domain-containing protein
MSFTPNKFDYANKTDFYRNVQAEAKALYESYWLTNLANLSASLNTHLPQINWVGFYLMVDGELKLGPFQGLPACLRIPLGKGVCGTTAKERRTIIVDDVNEFPGHITCDSRSLSEIVLPMQTGGRLLGVLDIDSPELARFDKQDQAGLEKIVADLITATEWPQSF